MMRQFVSVFSLFLSLCAKTAFAGPAMDSLIADIQAEKTFALINPSSENPNCPSEVQLGQYFSHDGKISWNMRLKIIQNHKREVRESSHDVRVRAHKDLGLGTHRVSSGPGPIGTVGWETHTQIESESQVILQSWNGSLILIFPHSRTGEFIYDANAQQIVFKSGKSSMFIDHGQENCIFQKTN